MFLQVCHVIDTGAGKMVQLHPIGSSYPTFPDSIWSHDLSALVSDPHNFYTCNIIKGADDEFDACKQCLTKEATFYDVYLSLSKGCPPKSEDISTSCVNYITYELKNCS